MTDRFKFRCWDEDRKCFLRDDEFVICPDGEDSYFNADYDFGDFVVEQCTGLKDKNGKLVYENDYIENDNTKDNVYLVVFDEKTARFMAKEMNGNLRLINKNVRVVGNIHE